MDKDQLNPVARHLIASYHETVIYSRVFLEDHASPPTLMSQVHYLLAATQAAIARDDRYELMPDYAEYGRVQFTDRDLGSVFLLRSSAAVAIEKSKQFEQMVFWEIPVPTSGVQLIVHEFVKDGLNLFLAETAQQATRRRLIARGLPKFIGFWPYSDPGDPRPGFSQSGPDPFGEVGGLGVVEEDDGETA